MIRIPDSLTAVRCTAQPPGNGSVEQLGDAYIRNLICDKTKTDQLEAIRAYGDKFSTDLSGQ